MAAPRRRRLDAELARRGLCASRAEAQEAVAAGLVTIDGAPARKSSTQVLPTQDLVVTAPPRRFVSRGGEKLAHALHAFAVSPAGRRCLDAGVSTGGFTDCLLQHGASHVHGVDVGYGQVHDRVRRSDRVTLAERTNIRDVLVADLPGGPADLIVCDVSFIALKTVLPVLRPLGTPDAEAIVLVKPQFEARREEVGKGGVVRDAAVWRRVLTEVAEAAAPLGWVLAGVTPSPLLGPAGNVEFLAHLVADAVPGDAARRIDAAVAEGERLRETEGAAGRDDHPEEGL